mgnify:CR=1 FL=1
MAERMGIWRTNPEKVPDFGKKSKISIDKVTGTCYSSQAAARQKWHAAAPKACHKRHTARKEVEKT